MVRLIHFSIRNFHVTDYSHPQLYLLTANEMYKMKLLEMQSKMREKEKRSNEGNKEKTLKEQKRREKWKSRVRRKRKGGYILSTIGTDRKFSDVQNKCKSIEDSKERVLESEQSIYEKERRKRKSIRRYKKYLRDLQNNLSQNKESTKLAYIERLEMRKRVTEKVLQKIKLKKNKNKDFGCNEKSSTAVNSEERVEKNCVDKSTKEVKREQKVKYRIMQKKYLSVIAALVTERKRKEKEEIDTRKRLAKRAIILKKQYEDRNHENISSLNTDIANVLPKETNYDAKPSKTENLSKKLDQLSFEENSVRLSASDSAIDRIEQKNIVLTQTEIDESSNRLSRAKRQHQLNKCTKFDDWKRKNAIPNDQMVFCVTGWYPTVRSPYLFLLFQQKL